MSFVYDEEELIWWPCMVSQPNADGDGKARKKKLNVLFTVPEQPELAEADDIEDRQEREQYLLDKLTACINDWDLVGRDKQKIECNEENIKKVLARPYIMIGVMQGWLEMSSGGARKKTSETGFNTSRGRGRSR